MSTKKQSKTADLPTKTKTTYVRPSRSKAAIAARTATKVATAREAADAILPGTGLTAREVIATLSPAKPKVTRTHVVGAEVRAITWSIALGCPACRPW